MPNPCLSGDTIRALDRGSWTKAEPQTVASGELRVASWSRRKGGERFQAEGAKTAIILPDVLLASITGH